MSGLTSTVCILPFKVKLMAMAASYEGKPIVQQVPGWVEMVEISLTAARVAACRGRAWDNAWG
jgi:hypothetical protein